MSLNNEYDFCYKVLIIGDTFVGKSNIFLRFLKNEIKEASLSTTGVEFDSKIVKFNEACIKLALWDTSGKDCYNYIKNAYYKGTHCFFIVYDITNISSFENVDKWFEDAKKVKDDAIFILIGNKIDDEKNRKISLEKGKEKAQKLNCSFFEASAFLLNNQLDDILNEAVKQMHEKFSISLDKELDKKNDSNLIDYEIKEDIPKNTILEKSTLFFKNFFPFSKNKDNSTNNNSKNKLKDLEEEIEKLKKKNNEYNKEISRLKKDIEQEKSNNKELSKKIKNLEKLLKEKDKELEINKKNNSLDINNKKLIELLEELRFKDKEIKDLKDLKLRYPFELLEGEKMMSIIFISTDQKIHHSIICKNTDQFTRIERLLYDEYPEYLDSENYFIVNGNRINRHKTLEENNIGNGNIITLN